MKPTTELLERLYSTMVRIRRFDEKTTELFQAGLVKGTAHSYVRIGKQGNGNLIH